MIKAFLLAAAVAGVAATGHLYKDKMAPAAEKAVGAAPGGMKPLDPKFVPPTVIGMNMGPFAYYLHDEILSDPTRGHAEISTNVNGGGVLASQVQRDENGWPINMAKGTKIYYMLSTANPLVRKMHCKTSPGWQVTGLLAGMNQAGTEFVASPNVANLHQNTTLEFTAEKDGASLTQLDCQVIDPKIAPGLYRPEFLADIKPYRVVRFMNWMLANSPQTGKWADRPTPKTMSIAEKGMPLEYMVDLANTGDFDPWFTLPINADDEYVRNFATYVHDHLKPGLRAYVEVSNEIWNPTFWQSKLVTKLGKARYPASDDTQANDFYYSDRVQQVMKIWTEIFAGQNKRIVRVLSNQAGWSQRADNALSHKDTWKYVDAVAIAPYFGDTLFPDSGLKSPRVDAILQRMPAYIDTAMGWAKANKAVAAKYGLPLVAYEAGPGVMAYEPTLANDVQAAVDDPRFVPLYAGFIDRWRKEIGGTLVLYNYDEGVWGHLKETGETWAKSAKTTAAFTGIAALPAQRDRLPADALAKLKQ